MKNRKLLVARKVMRPHVVQGQGQRQQRGVHTSEIPGPQLCCQFFRVGFPRHKDQNTASWKQQNTSCNTGKLWTVKKGSAKEVDTTDILAYVGMCIDLKVTRHGKCEQRLNWHKVNLACYFGNWHCKKGHCYYEFQSYNAQWAPTKTELTWGQHFVVVVFQIASTGKVTMNCKHLERVSVNKAWPDLRQTLHVIFGYRSSSRLPRVTETLNVNKDWTGLS